jgi:hypothetical protein
MAIITFKTVSVVVLIVLILAYAREIPEIIDAYSAKTGRVVDKDSGKGIPGVTVIVQGSFNSAGLFQGSHGCTFAAFGNTDAEGNYRTPSGWMHVSPGLPIWDPHNTWTINVVKPGYTLVDSNNRLTPHGRGANVSSTWNVLAVAVADIAMQHVDLPLKERVDDYAYADGSAGCIKVNPDLYFRMKREIFVDLKAATCALPADASVDSPTVFGLTSFSANFNPDYSPTVESVRRRMTKIDAGFPHIPDIPPQTYRAGDLCQVMTASESDR